MGQTGAGGAAVAVRPGTLMFPGVDQVWASVRRGRRRRLWRGGTHDGAPLHGAAAGRVSEVPLLADDLVHVLQLGWRVRLRAEATRDVSGMCQWSRVLAPQWTPCEWER